MPYLYPLQMELATTLLCTGKSPMHWKGQNGLEVKQAEHSRSMLYYFPLGSGTSVWLATAHSGTRLAGLVVDLDM